MSILFMRILFGVVCLLFSLNSMAQKKKGHEIKFYLFDKNWKGATADNAQYLGCFMKLNDSNFQRRFYYFNGPLISVETYKDEEAQIPDGYFAWFDGEGLIDSLGYIRAGGKKDQKWLYFTDSLTIRQTEIYNKGILIEKKNLADLNTERKKNDSIGFLPGDKEAQFKGGPKGWGQYLVRNIKFPERARSLYKTGRVVIYFEVSPEGSLHDLQVYKSVELSLDQEALRLIEQSPKWEPAMQLGKPVRAYRKQPFTFGE